MTISFRWIQTRRPTLWKWFSTIPFILLNSTQPLFSGSNFLKPFSKLLSLNFLLSQVLSRTYSVKNLSYCLLTLCSQLLPKLLSINFSESLWTSFSSTLRESSHSCLRSSIYFRCSSFTRITFPNAAVALFSA